MIEKRNRKFLNAKDISTLLDISISSSYRIIKKLNCELEEMGKITLAGKISKRYFEEKIYM